jgi:hypothetical protein
MKLSKHDKHHKQQSRRDFLIRSGGVVATAAIGSPAIAAGAAETVNIAALYPTTGNLAQIGQGCVVAAKLAVEMVNEAGGIKALGGAKLNLIISDVQSDTTVTLALGPSQTGYGQWRVVDSLIGGLVGIAVGVLVPERPPFAAAERAQAAWGDALHTQLTRIADELERPAGELVGRQRHAFIATSSALVEVATAGRRATALAQDGVAFNPWGRGHHEQLARLRMQESELVRVTLEIRVLSLTVDQLYDRPHHAPFLDRGTLAGLLRGCADLDRAHRVGLDVTAESGALRTQIAQAVAGVTQSQTDAYAVLDSVSLLGRLDQLRRDISGRHPADAPNDTLDIGHDPGDDAR